jgi:hypothetical protein
VIGDGQVAGQQFAQDPAGRHPLLLVLRQGSGNVVCLLDTVEKLA